MESERKELAEYKNILSITWYDIAEDEAACSAIYAFAYIPYRTTMVSHLATARRNFRISVNSLSVGDLIRRKGDLKSITYLARARNTIKENEPGYDTDADVLFDPNDVQTLKMNTKAVRGKSAKRKDRRKS